MLDTHALIWLDAGLPELGPRARRRIDRAHAGSSLAVASISFWEIGMLIAKSRVRLETSLIEWRAELIRSGLQELHVDGTIAIRASELPRFHGDPADRLIAATALLHEAALVTADRAMLDHRRVRTIDARR